MPVTKKKCVNVLLVDDGSGVVVRLSATWIRRLAAMHSSANADGLEHQFEVPMLAYETGWQNRRGRVRDGVGDLLEFHR